VSFSQALKDEEAKRQGSTISMASEAPSTASATLRKAAIKSAQKPNVSFAQALKEEQAKRTTSRVQGANNAPSTLAAIKRRPVTSEPAQKPAVSFAQSLRDEEAQRHGSVATTAPSATATTLKPAQKANVDFSKALNDEEAKRRASGPATAGKAPSVVPTRRGSVFSATPSGRLTSNGTFSDRLMAEESKGKGPVVSAPTDGPSSNSKSTAASNQKNKPAAPDERSTSATLMPKTTPAKDHKVAAKPAVAKQRLVTDPAASPKGSAAVKRKPPKLTEQ
jgi:hypothetical protein